MAKDFFGIKRNLDFVFCIDGTGSMGLYLDRVRRNVRKFYLDTAKALVECGNEIVSLRVKAVVFGDYKDGAEKAMQISPFFTLPAQNADFDNFLASVTVGGGGDYPENGLEALYYAIKSDFSAGANDCRIIALFTDADALPLRARAGEPGYPAEMPDERGLERSWNEVRSAGNLRLAVFAPTGSKYEELQRLCGSTVYPTDIRKGEGDAALLRAIEALAKSFGGGEASE